MILHRTSRFTIAPKRLRLGWNEVLFLFFEMPVYRSIKPTPNEGSNNTTVWLPNLVWKLKVTMKMSSKVMRLMICVADGIERMYRTRSVLGMIIHQLIFFDLYILMKAMELEQVCQGKVFLKLVETFIEAFSSNNLGCNMEQQK
ncbi:hypothetical protein L2E82_35548 [Cichorium intybus]|uniref:Uncharacterized protein n=1 Tax=Cichorium intybus TaxID=13427 RepID=A0ACB9BP81_CICIN|nr:hypothetical protein L2E82_35548 [Cichorium intybus]